VIAEPRATPSFDLSPVPYDVLGKIIQAGIEAPSDCNLQLWRFVVVRGAEHKRLVREGAMGQSNVEEAC
jgi:nitroreductase